MRQYASLVPMRRFWMIRITVHSPLSELYILKSKPDAPDITLGTIAGIGERTTKKPFRKSTWLWKNSSVGCLRNVLRASSPGIRAIEFILLSVIFPRGQIARIARFPQVDQIAQRGPERFSTIMAGRCHTSSSGIPKPTAWFWPRPSFMRITKWRRQSHALSTPSGDSRRFLRQSKSAHQRLRCRWRIPAVIALACPW
jgi:hypothetical protein